MTLIPTQAEQVRLDNKNDARLRHLLDVSFTSREVRSKSFRRLCDYPVLVLMSFEASRQEVSKGGGNSIGCGGTVAARTESLVRTALALSLCPIE